MSALAETLLESGLDAAETLGRSFVRIAGLVAPYGEWEPIGSFAEQFAPGVFTESLARQPNVPLLAFHSREQPALGLAEAWQEEAFGLYGVFRIAMTAAAQMASSYADEGLMNGLSVGFVPITSRWSYAGEYAPERGISHMDKVTRVKARLAEVSLVNAGAYQSARVTNVESGPADTGAGRASRALAARQPGGANYIPPASKHEPTTGPAPAKPVLPSNYAPPSSSHKQQPVSAPAKPVLPSNYVPKKSAQQQAPDPAAADDAVTSAPDDIDDASSLAEVVQYLRWIANRLSAIEGVAGGAVVTTGSPDVAGGGVATPTEAVVP